MICNFIDLDAFSANSWFLNIFRVIFWQVNIKDIQLECKKFFSDNLLNGWCYCKVVVERVEKASQIKINQIFNVASFIYNIWIDEPLITVNYYYFNFLNVFYETFLNVLWKLHKRLLHQFLWLFDYFILINWILFFSSIP
jgi:hypothetical protein